MTAVGQTRLFAETNFRPLGPNKRKVWDGDGLTAPLSLLLPRSSEVHTVMLAQPTMITSTSYDGQARRHRIAMSFR